MKWMLVLCAILVASYAITPEMMHDKRETDCDICKKIIKDARNAYNYSGEVGRISYVISMACSGAPSGYTKVCNKLKGASSTTLATYFSKYSDVTICAKYSLC